MLQVAVTLLLFAGSVYSQYDYVDTSNQNDQIELLHDINNLAATNTANQNNGEEVFPNFASKFEPEEDRRRFETSKIGLSQANSNPSFSLGDSRLSRLITERALGSNNIFPQQTLSIDVALGSELITSPNRSPTILFDVTNYKNTTVDVVFYCNLQQSLINSLNPTRTKINPKETIRVQLNLGTRPTAYQDEVTLTANAGSETVEKRVLLDVGTITAVDNTAPSLDYSFLSDCSKYIFADCSQGSWTIDVRAKDTESGLLQVTTNPKGIYFPNGFTTGSTEEITGTYSDTCCNAELKITAIDRAGNTRQMTTNAFRSTWGPGQIAAVVLGVFLLISIIIVVIYFVRKAIKKKREFSLPTYRGSGSKSSPSFE